MLKEITQACQYLLYNFPGAEPIREYLDSRLTRESQKKFNFGYYPNSNDLSILIDLVGEEILKKNELLYYWGIEDSMAPRNILISYFEHYPLVMPFKNAYGHQVGLVARTMLSDEERKPLKIPKYKNTKDFKKGNVLFGLYENKKEILDLNQVYIVEGQFDAIKSNEIGMKNVVAIGNAMMTTYQFSVISRYTNNIILLLDNDQAGEKGRKAIINKFGKLANIQNFYIPKEYKDIDEYITKEQISDFAQISFSAE